VVSQVQLESPVVAEELPADGAGGAPAAGRLMTAHVAPQPGSGGRRGRAEGAAERLLGAVPRHVRLQPLTAREGGAASLTHVPLAAVLLARVPQQVAARAVRGVTRGAREHVGCPGHARGPATHCFAACVGEPFSRLLLTTWYARFDRQMTYA